MFARHASPSIAAATSDGSCSAVLPRPPRVHFLDSLDKEMNERGARGTGEIGLVSFTAPGVRMWEL
jgi:hypothetical protein